MTRHILTRCEHCSVVYTVQTSGQKADWYNDQSDSSTYCKDCWAAVCEALSRIPKRCEKFFEEVTDDDELKKVFDKKQHDKENPKRLFGPGGPIVREVGGSMFRMDGRKAVATMHSTVVRLESVRHSIERWSDGSEPAKVVREMERDLRTKVERPWKDYQ